MTEASRTPTTAEHPNTFVLKRAVPIPSLNLTVEEYEHPGTGATHLHLSSDSTENVFMVALRTVPEDSTGSRTFSSTPRCVAASATRCVIPSS
ncbi:MAG: hypothetical protein CM15mP74_04850 [Halieaceae bacterium]|nr:MAG: hypothetical protein CM15mP74_04850 [Halieaceae bacterium]